MKVWLCKWDDINLKVDFFHPKEWYVSEFDHKFVFGKYEFGIGKNWSEKWICLYLFRFLYWKSKWFLNYVSLNTLDDYRYIT